jgi:hypothetical protein
LFVASFHQQEWRSLSLVPALIPVNQFVVRGLGAVAKLSVLAGRALGANRFEIDDGEDGVLGLDNAGGLFFEK